MKVNKVAKENYVILELAGEVNFNCVADFKKAFTEVLEQGPANILVNMQGVSYIDSCGIASFVESHQKSKAKNISFKLYGVSPKVKKVFEVTKLGKLFQMFATLADALKT